MTPVVKKKGNAMTDEKQHMPPNIQTLLDCLSVAGMIIIISLALYILVWDIPTNQRGNPNYHPTIEQENTR